MVLSSTKVFVCVSTQFRNFSVGLMNRIIEDESGQGTVEYILILSLSVVAASKLAKSILSSLDAAIKILGGTLEQDLKSGRLAPGAWGN